MSELQGRFTPNRDDIAAKVIDGELIIIRLSDGTYYSMEDVGTRIWELLEAGHALPALIEAIAPRYAAPVERIATDVRALVQDLLSEGLILPAAEDGLVPATTGPVAEPAPYGPPQLNIYRDMGNLLALDPPTPGIDDLLFREGKGG